MSVPPHPSLSPVGDCVAIMVDGVSVILNPSLPVILSKAKDLIPLRVDSVKNLIKSTS